MSVEHIYQVRVQDRSVRSNSVSPHAPWRSTTFVVIAERLWSTAAAWNTAVCKQVRIGAIYTLSFGNDLMTIPASTADKNYYIDFELRIKDTGVGISPENIEKLFMNFAKLEEHNDMNKQGTGLGLSICKSLIELMGGSVRVES